MRFQAMSLKRTMRYSIFFILFIASAGFLNLNLAYKNVDRNPMGTELKLGVNETFRKRHGRLLNVSCTLNLHPVTTENCYHFYYKTSSTEVLKLHNFGSNISFSGEMVAITYTKIDQNYSKYTFNKGISQTLQSIRSDESNITYCWIIFAMSLLFL